MKKYSTNKLYFGKYPYKLVWRSPIANWFRGGDLPFIRETLDKLQNQHNMLNRPLNIGLWNKSVVVNSKDLYYAQIVYSTLCQNNNYRLRIEGSSVVIYADTLDWLETLSKKLDDTVEEFWRPETILQPNTVIMSSKMQGWGYRLTFNGSVPIDFKKWAVKNLDKIRVGPILKEMLYTNRGYAHGLYFYVKNEKTVSLVSLMLGDSISRIDKILVEDKNA